MRTNIANPKNKNHILKFDFTAFFERFMIVSIFKFIIRNKTINRPLKKLRLFCFMNA